MTKVEIFERALCCETGVCGPNVDEELVLITAIEKYINDQGKDEIARTNLASNPKAFANQPIVYDLIKKNGAAALPVTIIDGKLMKTGEYPSVSDISNYLGIDLSNKFTQVSQ
ncbi:arsenite efflux transporter metallochaperone ArsD [Companilactobacillus versmoldensis]|uniref:Arsenical resistance operon trans-acting repressor ArsD n=1 Tax=Companilactobacillus versmoldensis DSM 14857 = KCTC 3814 TaxID=1423815 RepID=A0A0R1SFS7_9LACO|nr:arsenite efflux transporter metallochaperone ArsD [Companilactobacillus versmoldensis]KRL65482.1 Arsenical resistance operon trans-acting repressor ArsD [Companilactobacillus versmoldensis DSM 14857 = KCTC 3814]